MAKATATKAKKVIKSTIAHHRTIPISPSMVIEEYTYVFVDGITSNRPRETYKESQRKGWVKKVEDQEVIKKNGTGLWIKRYVYKKPETPRPRKPKTK